MQVTVNTDEFKNAVKNAEKAINYKLTLPVLQNIRVKVKDNECYIYGSNLKQFIRISISTIGNCEDGEIIFSDTKAIVKALKFFKDLETTISYSKQEGITIQCGKKKANVTCIETEYITFPELNEYETYTYQSEVLFKRLNSVKYAMSKTDIRPIYQGIHFSGCDIVAVDGYRLAVNSDETLSVANEFTIPPNILKFAKSIQGNIDIKVSDKYFCMENSDTIIISKLMEGEYLNYKKAIPDNMHIYQVKRDTLIDGLQYLKSFIGNSETCYEVGWREDMICCNTSEGAFESTIEINSPIQFEIGFNVNYMIDAVSQFKNEDVLNFSMLNSRSPIIIKKENNLALVLPVKLDESIGSYPFKKTSKSA